MDRGEEPSSKRAKYDPNDITHSLKEIAQDIQLSISLVSTLKRTVTKSGPLDPSTASTSLSFLFHL
jgi:hypothetical protein